MGLHTIDLEHSLTKAGTKTKSFNLNMITAEILRIKTVKSKCKNFKASNRSPLVWKQKIKEFEDQAQIT